MRRRDFVTLAGTGLLGACSKPTVQGFGKRTPQPTRSPEFRHGVASGDPLSDRVILWTRVSGELDGIDVEVQIDTSREFAQPQVFHQSAHKERDFTVKVDATGLEPDTTYYYRFSALGVQSAVGRTRTLPTGSVDHLRMGFCSCSNLPWGYFNVYRQMAKRADLACLLHLGDYIYEYANGEYGDGRATGRIPEPNREIVSLADYRQRHAQYKRDPDLQELHRQHPMIAIWDDHELTDDAWRDGAKNHQPKTEGSWRERRDNAVRAYYEWLPIREQGTPEQAITYRSFRFGDLCHLAMLDTRLVGRDEQVAADDPLRDKEQRTLLGNAQEDWLDAELKSSANDGVGWTVLGQQVMLAPVRLADGSFISLDKWDGYPRARQRLLDALVRERRDTIVLTGDFHSSWAMDVPHAGKTAAVEFLGPGVSSPGPSEVKNPDKQVAELYQVNSHLRWVELTQRGYAVLDLNRERAQCDWFFVPTVDKRTHTERFARGFTTSRDALGLTPAASPAPELDNSPPLA